MPVLPGHARDDLARLAAAHAGIDPLHRVRIRCDDGIDEQPLERMIEIPVIDDVLEVPDDLARIGVECQRRVVVEVLLPVAAEHVFRCGRGHRRADIDAVQLRIVARHHPHADVPTLLVGNVAPGFVAGLAGLRDRAAAPHFAAGFRVESRDHARFGAALGLAAPSRDDLAVGDDGARAVLRAGTVVEDVRFPDELARACIQRVRIAVRAVVENQVVVDREIAVRLCRREVLTDVLGHLAAVLPDEIAGRGVQRLSHVIGIREIQDPVVYERRALLIGAVAERPRPHELELRDVAPVDLVEGAVAPAVQRAPPHQPVGRRRIRKHLVGDRREIRHRVLCGGRCRVSQSRSANDGDETGSTNHASFPQTFTERAGILAQKPRPTCGRGPASGAAAR